MTRRGGREQAPSERNESFPHTRANDQAALCLTGGDVYNNRNEQSSTRYIMSGNDVPHAVTFTPTSLQQMRTGFLNPADDEGLPFAQHVDQEDEFFMQPSSVQVQSDADWQYTADEHAWSRYRYPEMPFAEPWSSANQQTGADSSLLDTNEWREDTLRGINEPAEMELEVSMNFDTDPHQDFLISDPPFAGNPNTPPWSIYTQNCLELQQLQQGLTTPVNGPRTSAVSCSTRTEDTPESSFVIVDPAGMSSMSSLSHCEEDMAGSNLTIHPNRQTHGNFDCWFKHTASDQMNASATQDLQTPLAERGRPQTALDPRSVDQSLASPQYSSSLNPTQTSSEDNDTTSTTASTSFPLVKKLCPMCGVEFSGIHQTNNLARHKRIQHNGCGFPCLEATCRKVFKRQDARLKHVRRHHPGLAPDAVPRPERRSRPRNARTTPIWPGLCDQ